MQNEPPPLPPLSDELYEALVDCLQQVRARQDSLRINHAALTALDIEIRELEDALLSSNSELQQWYSEFLRDEKEAHNKGIYGV